MGVTLIPTLAASVVRPDITLRPTTPALPKRRLFAAVAQPEHRTAAASAMLAHLQTVAASHK